jgi:HD-GYP domain-containing protein (c-di-GMP phosphodiesterase class II)
MGFSDKELVDIRRGALLHDIGKIAIPDHVLFKPGKLSEEEWDIMRKHPVYAYELLSPIAYLLSAVDIPYCHHERWDGNGYPRGLSGIQIPLPARIFAVIDVWDALGSDRCYRSAWEQPAIREYLVSEKGKGFDSEVVDEFLLLLDEMTASAKEDHPLMDIRVFIASTQLESYNNLAISTFASGNTTIAG